MSDNTHDKSNIVYVHTPISDADGNQIGYSTSKTDSKGRVIPTHETVENELIDLMPPMTEKQLNKLTAYVMQQKNDDYYHGVRVGIAMGRKEMLAVMETVIGEDDISVPLSASAALWQDSVNGMKAEQRERLSQAVAAISKSTEVPDEQ